MSLNNQTNKGSLMSLKWYISMVSIWGSSLKLLRVACASCLLHLYLYLFLWGSCLGVTLISISSTVPACSIPLGYMHKPVWCACMFNSLKICAGVLSILTHEGVLGGWSTGNDKGGLTREHNLLEILVTLGGASFLGQKNLLRSLVVILTDEEVYGDVWSIEEDFLFLYGSLGNLCYFYPWGSFINFTGIIFFTTHEGVAIVLRTHGAFPSWYCTLLGIYLKIWTLEGVPLVTYGPLRDAFDAFHLLWMLMWSLCL